MPCLVVLPSSRKATRQLSVPAGCGKEKKRHRKWLLNCLIQAYCSSMTSSTHLKQRAWNLKRSRFKTSTSQMSQAFDWTRNETSKHRHKMGKPLQHVAAVANCWHVPRIPSTFSADRVQTTRRPVKPGWLLLETLSASNRRVVSRLTPHIHIMHHHSCMLVLVCRSLTGSWAGINKYGSQPTKTSESCTSIFWKSG